MNTRRIQQFEIYVCDACRDYFYSEESGDKSQNISAGTLVDELPDSFECPNCKACKSDLRPVMSIGSTAW